MNDNKYTCQYCGVVYDRMSSLKGHYGTCKKKAARLECLLPKDILEKRLETESANSIALSFPDEIMHAGTIIALAKRYGLKTHTLKEAAGLPSARASYASTCMEKYGASNALGKDTEPYKKRNQTVKDIYGVANVFQLEDVKLKSRESMLRIYGVENNAYRGHLGIQRGWESSLHRHAMFILDELEIKYESEKVGNFLTYSKDLGKKYNPRPDITIEDRKVIIDVRGDLWHANPALYKSSDRIPLFRGPTPAEAIWLKDKVAVEIYESFGYQVLILWESEKENFRELICKFLKLQG